MREARNFHRRLGSKGVSLFKTLSPGISTKSKAAILALGGGLLAIGNTETAESAEPPLVQPDEIVHLQQADVVISDLQTEDGTVSFQATFLNTSDYPFNWFMYRKMFTLESNGEKISSAEYDISMSPDQKEITRANPGIPFTLIFDVQALPNLTLTLNNLSFRKSNLDMSYDWFDPVPRSRLKLS